MRDDPYHFFSFTSFIYTRSKKSLIYAVIESRWVGVLEMLILRARDNTQNLRGHNHGDIVCESLRYELLHRFLQSCKL